MEYDINKTRSAYNLAEKVNRSKCYEPSITGIQKREKLLRAGGTRNNERFYKECDSETKHRKMGKI